MSFVPDCMCIPLSCWLLGDGDDGVGRTMMAPAVHVVVLVVGSLVPHVLASKANVVLTVAGLDGWIRVCVVVLMCRGAETAAGDTS